MYVMHVGRLNCSVVVIDFNFVSQYSGSKLVYRRNGTYVTVLTYSSSLLSCTAYQWFWVTWEGGQLMVGLGNVTLANAIMVYNDPKPFSIDSVAVSSYSGSSTVTYWTFPGYLYTKGNAIELILIKYWTYRKAYII